MTIDNQCTNIELTSPVYFIKDTDYHIQFPQQVNHRSIMKANFVTGIDQDTFGGVLLYHLKRKNDASISVQLLVIWKYKSNGIHSRALLVEHESTLAWDKVKLKRLYDGYGNQYEAYSVMNKGRWLLSDNIRLGTSCNLSYGGFKMNISIYEEDLPYFMFPPWIDSNR
jgi:hypothetical protein